jgi:HPt (histidine-containing phosphotransfer) domain-containing protein
MSDTVLNMQDLTEKLGDDPELIRELLQMFREDHENEIKVVAERIAAGDLQQAHQMVHSIKGASGNISAEALYHAAKALDDQIKTGDCGPCDEMLGRLDREMGRLFTYIDAL